MDESFLLDLAKNLDPDGVAVQLKPLVDAGLAWREFIQKHFPHVTTHPFGERHVRLWEWADALTPGVQPQARVEIWPRGGAKSSTGELICTRVCAKLSRRFVLYVCETQDQADKHVQSIGALLEGLVERAVNKYGHSKGWQRQQLRTANGFNVTGIGLDKATRGVKLDQFRPDLIIFDDIDNQTDSLATIEKKIAAITTAIIPAGSSDVAILFLQNLIHEESIVNRLVEGRADFLHDREPPILEAAVIGLETEIVEREDGQKVYRITAGVPTWEGQSLAICEKQINDWGLKAFKREAQHEVQGADGYYFDTAQIQSVDPGDVPNLESICLAWDLAATEGGGDWTVGLVMGRAANATYYVLAVIRGQWASNRVRVCIDLADGHYREHYRWLTLRLPQDGGQAGKDQAEQFEDKYVDAQPKIKPVTGKKWHRARGLAEAVNVGNVYLVREDLPAIFRSVRDERTGGSPLIEDLSWAKWQHYFKEELRKFKEYVEDQVDDQVDAGADAFNEIALDRNVTYLPSIL